MGKKLCERWVKHLKLQLIELFARCESFPNSQQSPAHTPHFHTRDPTAGLAHAPTWLARLYQHKPCIFISLAAIGRCRRHSRARLCIRSRAHPGARANLRWSLRGAVLRLSQLNTFPKFKHPCDYRFLHAFSFLDAPIPPLLFRLVYLFVLFVGFIYF